MNKNLSDKQINYLGALLHDIGKLIWRSRDIKAGESHESLGEEFIREYLGKVECLKNDIEQIIKASKRERGSIWKSDVVAATEREDSLDKAPRRYLEAITNRVDLNKPEIKSKSDNYWYYLPKQLNLNKVGNFPINSKDKLKNYKHDEKEYQNLHKGLLDEFIKEVGKLRNENDFNAFLRTFIKLLEKYTTKVLSAGYLSHPDISLFDHSRITASLSLCYDSGEKNKECLLIKGDISGIQSYIYSGIREMTDIAKRLRGRSFTIQLLSDVLSNYILDKLDLFEANLIYNGGGHFLILAPSNDSNKEILKNLTDKINFYLMKKYIGKISLILDYVECSGTEFINDFRKVYRSLDEKISNNKKLKFRSLLKELFTLEITAKEFRNNEKEIENIDKKIGEIIPKLKYLIFSPIQLVNNGKVVSINFKEFDTFIYLCKEQKNVEDLTATISNKTGIRIISLNNTEVINTFTRDIFNNLSKEFRFLGNNVPIKVDDKNEKIISFEELAEKYSPNYPLLGIMRMDVDNLGSVFSFGLKEVSDAEKKYTPSRVANLSRELNWFFTGYINEVAKRYNIYIAYSGGDDVFAVGNWYEIIKFTSTLRKEFDEFVCHNKNLSASAGIIFTKPNFPISQSALLAGEQESIAKNTVPVIEKDKVSVLDIQMTWKEFNEFINYADELIEFLETDEGNKIIPRSFLYSIYSITNNIFDYRGKLNFRKLNRAKRILHYNFARKKVNSSVIENKNKDNKINRLLYDLAIKLLLNENKEQAFKKIKFPLTLVLYKTRR